MESMMTSRLPRPVSGLPDVFEWFGADWPFDDRHPARIESFAEGGDFIVRAELPGMDPDRDIHITVEQNQLKISAERTQEEHTDQRSEFRYGSYSRTVALPAGCDTDAIDASYDAGILNVRMPLRERISGKEVPIARAPKD
jgi:HSP20 family protein